MAKRRVLLLGLDGFDVVLAERFASEGLLPNFTRLQAQGASFDLDHGRDKLSGLAWEQLSSGVRPSDGGRWSVINFDNQSYQATQDYTVVRPFLADKAAKTVIFDVPYFDLSLAPNVRGITSWGAHDPGVASASRPSGLHQEMSDLFGEYPAQEWIYGFCWPSAQKAQATGDGLADAVEVRSRASRWLLKERLPDWDLGVVAISESHSAVEQLWHGVDPHHPLHVLDSAPPAAAGLRKVYVAIDHLIGELHQTFSDATLVLVAMHGMGANDADIPTMVLLPELLYRWAFGSVYMRPLEFPRVLPDGTPVLAEDTDNWAQPLFQAVPQVQAVPPARPNFLQRALSRLKRRPDGRGEDATGPDLSWMPSARYAPFWPKMTAFALPAYYDGRVRLNVAGREKRGIVPVVGYTSVCRQISDLIGECRNLLTGKPVVSEIHCPKQNPHEVGPSEADLYIDWEGAPLGLVHPRLGTIGPIPYSRTGGHTGTRGFLNVVGSDIPKGHHGLASSFDVVPTIIELLGESRPPGISGKSLMPEFVTARSR